MVVKWWQVVRGGRNYVVSGGEVGVDGVIHADMYPHQSVPKPKMMWSRSIFIHNSDESTCIQGWCTTLMYLRKKSRH